MSVVNSPMDRAAWVISLDVDCYAKAVLHVLVYRASSTTLECWITVDRLAKEAGMSRRKVQATVRALESAGLVEAARSDGRKANTYRVNVEANHAQRAPLNRAQRAPLSVVNRAQEVRQPCTTGNLTVHAVHPEPGIEPGIEPARPSVPSIWDLGRSMLGGQLLGKCIKEHGEEIVAQAITSTDLKRPGEPKSYLLAILKSKKPPEVPRVTSDW